MLVLRERQRERDELRREGGRSALPCMIRDGIVGLYL